MHPLSPALTAVLAQAAAVPSPDSLHQPFMELVEKLRGDGQTLLIALLLGQLTTIVAYWLASKTVAEGRGTFGRAIQTYFLYFLTKLGILVVCAAGIYVIVGRHGGGGIGQGAIIVGCAAVGLLFVVLGIYVAFAVPMWIYRIHFGSALLFLILSAILSFAGAFGTERALGNPLAKAQVIIRDWKAKLPPGSPILGGKTIPGTEAEDSPFAAAERRAADRSKSVIDRQDALKEIYGRLETMRKDLKPGDAAAIAEYQRRKTRYEQLLNDLRADVGARRGSEI